jgi:hypothetical protein
MNKKGASDYGVSIATGVLMSLFLLVLISIAVLVGISTLNNTTLLPAGSAERNASLSMTANLTDGATIFAGYFPTFFKIIAVVIIMGFIGLLIYVVYRFARGTGKEGGL